MWQRILGTEPVPEVIRTPADELPPLLDSVRLAGSANTGAMSPRLRTELTATQDMLDRHVGLLTSGALPPVQGTDPAAAGSPAPPSGTPAPTDPRRLAEDLAAAGVGLVDAALEAPDQRSRSLSGAGFELIMQARNLLGAAGGTQAQIDRLPAPNPAAAAAGVSGPSAGPADLPRFMLSGCPAGADSAPRATAPAELDVTGVGALGSDSGDALGLVADAAYRLGYAYNVAGARTAGDARSNAWARSEAMVELAAAVELQFAGVGECAPLRQPAYQLPDDAVANPLDAARSGEEQLALLLRDAAATQQGEARAFLLQRAWAQGLYTRQVTGKIPDFTHVPGEGVGTAPSGGPAPTP